MKLPSLAAPELGAGLVVLVVALVLLWNFDPFGRRERAEEKAVTATVQADVNAATADITADVAEDKAHIHRKAQEVTDALDASTDMDGDLAIWSTGIDRVLDGSERPSDQAERQPEQPDA